MNNVIKHQPHHYMMYEMSITEFASISTAPMKLCIAGYVFSRTEGNVTAIFMGVKVKDVFFFLGVYSILILNFIV
jgi:hypothetical protein